VAAVAPLLETTALSRGFGGLRAVDDVDFRIAAGEIRAIIGPNGAGKTTLVSMISGRLRPSSGRIAFHGEEITRLRARDRVARGIVYTFQLTSVYGGLTCHENVALAAQRRLMRGPFGGLWVNEDQLLQSVSTALARVGLSAARAQRADELPYGHRRLLEIAMGIALDPELLILDEPTQGLAAGEIANFSALVRELAETATILLIEHNMSVVLDLASRITVMDAGAIVADGTPAEIQGSAETRRAYLGR